MGFWVHHGIYDYSQVKSYSPNWYFSPIYKAVPLCAIIFSIECQRLLYFPTCILLKGFKSSSLYNSKWEVELIISCMLKPAKGVVSSVPTQKHKKQTHEKNWEACEIMSVSISFVKPFYNVFVVTLYLKRSISLKN